MENLGFPRENFGFPMENLGFPRQNLGFPIIFFGNFGFPIENLGFPIEILGNLGASNRIFLKFRLSTNNLVFPIKKYEKNRGFHGEFWVSKGNTFFEILHFE